MLPFEDAGALDQATVVFLDVHPRLFGIAYRMLGIVAEAEDIVQDAWLRWQSTDRTIVQDATAFLITTTTRLAINFMQSARSRREAYIGPWLPEPIDTRSDPTLGAERGEALELAVLLLLEKLTPNERAAYVLREAFDYSHHERQAPHPSLLCEGWDEPVERYRAVNTASISSVSQGGEVARASRLVRLTSHVDGIVQISREEQHGLSTLATNSP